VVVPDVDVLVDVDHVLPGSVVEPGPEVVGIALCVPELSGPAEESSVVRLPPVPVSFAVCVPVPPELVVCVPVSSCELVAVGPHAASASTSRLASTLERRSSTPGQSTGSIMPRSPPQRDSAGAEGVVFPVGELGAEVEGVVQGPARRRVVPF